MPDAELLHLMRTIAAGDTDRALQQVTQDPSLATASLTTGATREAPDGFFLADIGHHLYTGDTALHVAAAAHRPPLAQALLNRGADVHATNRRGARPLHYAADGSPGSPRWDPQHQAATITALIAAGADPEATDRSGVTPLHRAVRTRCADAVAALLAGGADPRRTNGNGSTPADLATRTTGRSGSGSAEAKAQQQRILELLRPWLRAPAARSAPTP